MINYHNRKKPKTLTRLLPNEVEDVAKRLNIPVPDEVWISRYYFVQVYHKDHTEYGWITRLSINSVRYNRNGWKDGLKWDELQQIKKDVGYGDNYAIEVYPKEKDIVNVANIRHLWILHDKPLDIGWTKES